MDDDRDIIWLLKETGLALTRYDRELLRIGDLTPAENHLLGYFLAHEDLDLCATDLHLIFGISKPTVSALLKSLKKRDTCGSKPCRRMSEKAHSADRQSLWCTRTDQSSSTRAPGQLVPRDFGSGA